MKNIHVLPTDKEPVKGDLLLRHIWKDTSNECISWWRYKDTIVIDDVLQYTTLNGSFRDITSSFKVQNIYITSNEEIKEGDYFYQNFDSIIHKCYKLTDNYIIAEKPSDYPKKICKKIILTTDQDLIKYGVQAIDDEFLEWFFKNRNYEWVEIKKDNHLFCKHCNTLHSTYGDGVNCDVCRRESNPYSKILGYKIIIPKEEPKQETLEEAALKHCDMLDKFPALINPLFSFKEGAKWQQDNSNINALNFEIDALKKQIELLKYQQERMYSEEEVVKILLARNSDLGIIGKTSAVIEFIKQFKKK